MTGRIKNLTFDVFTRRQQLTLELFDDARSICDKYRDTDISVEIGKLRKKRSLDANAYCWVLIGKLADKLTAPKDEVYLTMLKRYGQGGVLKVPKTMAADFERSQKYFELHESMPEEEKAVYYRFWVGSSMYDTVEMSSFIDGIISEAKEMDIETATPEEVANMKSLWQQAPDCHSEPAG